MVPRCVIVGAALAVAGGALFGFIRGLDYLPTLPFAVIEGAVLVGVPGGVAATVLAGLITLGRRRHVTRSPEEDQP